MWTPALLTLLWSLTLSSLTQVLWVFVGYIRSPRLILLSNLLSIATVFYKSCHCFLSSVSSQDCLSLMSQTHGKTNCTASNHKGSQSPGYLSDTLWSTEITSLRPPRALELQLTSLISVFRVWDQVPRYCNFEHLHWVVLGVFIKLGMWPTNSVHFPSISHVTFHLFSSFSASISHSKTAWSLQHLYSVIH